MLYDVWFKPEARTPYRAGQATYYQEAGSYIGPGDKSGYIILQIEATKEQILNIMDKKHLNINKVFTNSKIKDYKDNKKIIEPVSFDYNYLEDVE